MLFKQPRRRNVASRCPQPLASHPGPQRADSQRRLLTLAAIRLVYAVTGVLREVLHGTPDWEHVARVEGFRNTLGAERLMPTAHDESGNVPLNAHAAARYADPGAGDIPPSVDRSVAAVTGCEVVAPATGASKGYQTRAAFGRLFSLPRADTMQQCSTGSFGYALRPRAADMRPAPVGDCRRFALFTWR